MSKDVFEHIDSLRIDPPVEVWTRLEKSLGGKKNRKGFFLLWGGLLLGLFAIGGLYLSQSKTIAQSMKYSEDRTFSSNDTYNEAGKTKWGYFEAERDARVAKQEEINENAEYLVEGKSNKEMIQDGRTKNTLPKQGRKMSENMEKDLSVTASATKGVMPTSLSSADPITEIVSAGSDFDPGVKKYNSTPKAKTFSETVVKEQMEFMPILSTQNFSNLDLDSSLVEEYFNNPLEPFLQFPEDYYESSCTNSLVIGVNRDLFTQNYNLAKMGSFNDGVLSSSSSRGLFAMYQKELNSKWTFSSELSANEFKLLSKKEKPDNYTSIAPNEGANSLITINELFGLYDVENPFNQDTYFEIKSLSAYLNAGLEYSLVNQDNWGLALYSGFNLSVLNKTEMIIYESEYTFNRYFKEFGISIAPRIYIGKDCGFNAFLSPQIDLLFDKDMHPDFNSINTFLRFKVGLRYSF